MNRLAFLLLLASQSIFSLAESNCAQVSSISSIGLEKSIFMDGQYYKIIERQRSIVAVPQPERIHPSFQIGQTYANLEFSPGQYWTGEIDPKQVVDVKLIIEPRWVNDRHEGHAMLLVSLRHPQFFYKQDALSKFMLVQDLVFSINPQKLFLENSSEPEEKKLMRYRVISLEEIVRKFRKNQPVGEVEVFNFSFSLTQKQDLVQLWLVQAMNKGETEVFDYHCNNCATNLHQIFRDIHQPNTFIEKTLWLLTGFHLLGGNEGRSIPRILGWRGLLSTEGSVPLYKER